MRTSGLAELLALEPAGTDRFAASGPRYPWGVLYGGQVAAQALRAASLTVEPGRLVHSLHAYYLRAGRDDAPVELEVARVRDGRSFSTRSVVARQGGAEVLVLTAGFHAEEASPPEAGARPPTAASPDVLAPGGWSPLFDRRYAPTGGAVGRTLAWLRVEEPLDDAATRACALAYVADDIPDDAVGALLHPDRRPANDYETREETLETQSLDYSLWFHRPPPAGWWLHDFRCSSLANACAMVVGDVFDETGAHIATVGQHVLVREPRRRP